MYHRFNENKYPSTNIKVDIFKKQLELIEESNIEFYDPDKFDNEFYNPKKKMFNLDYLRKSKNSLENIASKKYPVLIKIRSYLKNLKKPIFVRMSGSGSAFIAYYASKRQCDMAQKQFNKDHKKYWCISSKTI